MKELYLLRHARTKKNGFITHEGQKEAERLSNILPLFNRVYCSKIEAAGKTAATLAPQVPPVVHEEIGYYFPDPEKEHEIFQKMHTDGLSYIDATQVLGYTELIGEIETSATILNTFIDDRLEKATFNSSILIVTDAVIIGEAMLQRNVSLELIPFNRGYIVKENGSIARFMPGLQSS